MALLSVTGQPVKQLGIVGMKPRVIRSERLDLDAQGRKLCRLDSRRLASRSAPVMGLSPMVGLPIRLDGVRESPCCPMPASLGHMTKARECHALRILAPLA